MKKRLSQKVSDTEYAAAHAFRKALEEILEEKLKEQINLAQSNDYQSPAWSEKQADRIGMMRAYSNILELIEEK